MTVVILPSSSGLDLLVMAGEGRPSTTSGRPGLNPMKFTLSWLRTHLDTDASAETIGETLTRIGLELESIHTRAELAPFRIARVIEAVQHPNADRLRACRVDTGNGEVSVVCGAPNARTGMKGVFAPPGSFIPGTGITLKVGEIRGVKSAGMLLSAREMGLGDDHTGIIDLPEDAPVGESYAHWAGLDDPLFDIGVTPNRGDCLSVRGVARDLAAAGLGRLLPWNPAPVPPGVRRRPALAHRLPAKPAPGSSAAPSGASATAPAPTGSSAGSPRSACAPSTPWSMSPTSSPATSAGRSTSSTPTRSPAPN